MSEPLRGVGQRLARSVDAAVIGRDQPVTFGERSATASPDSPAAAASPRVIIVRREICAHSGSLRRWRSAPVIIAHDARPESGEPDHRDVDQQERHERNRHQEMQRARGLPAAKIVTVDGTAERTPATSPAPSR